MPQASLLASRLQAPRMKGRSGACGACRDVRPAATASLRRSPALPSLFAAGCHDSRICLREQSTWLILLARSHGSLKTRYWPMFLTRLAASEARHSVAGPWADAQPGMAAAECAASRRATPTVESEFPPIIRLPFVLPVGTPLLTGAERDDASLGEGMARASSRPATGRRPLAAQCRRPPSPAQPERLAR